MVTKIKENVETPTNIAITNITMILAARGIARKDAADAIGKIPQAFSRMLKKGYSWSFDDMIKISHFLRVSVSDLTNENLPMAVILGKNKTAASEDDGGGIVAGSGFEPETSGSYFGYKDDYVLAA